MQISSYHSLSCARILRVSISILRFLDLGDCAHPTPVLGSPKSMSAAKIHGGTPTPTWRTRDAKEASVLFRPELSALYGKEEPIAVSWVVGRKAVAAGEAEPIDGRVRILGMMTVEARFAILAIIRCS